MNWRQLFERSVRIIRIACVVILLVVLAMAGYQLYTFYHDRLGNTPAKAVEGYFVALGQGDTAEVYRLTDKSKLTDIQGRPVSRDSFEAQLDAITGGRILTFSEITVERIYRKSDMYYFHVKLASDMSSSTSYAELVVEVRREADAWVITYPFGTVY